MCIHVHTPVVLVHHVRPPLFGLLLLFLLQSSTFVYITGIAVSMIRLSYSLRPNRLGLSSGHVSFWTTELFDNKHFTPVDRQAYQRKNCNSLPKLGITPNVRSARPAVKIRTRREEISALREVGYATSTAVPVCGSQS